jgi:hypothetical protein
MKSAPPAPVYALAPDPDRIQANILKLFLPGMPDLLMT